ncbi:MAG: 1-acyl-sn-glycerol-3-phosphate acyltransferase [Proteobacteria bacterium]|nr:1-acyl-sn-glycerol-3-phosphate acyltransferase [Pseudomonadota bacterium]MBU4296419.1 1-acyl-sn-glycerol-3-phosphate acyltransferase [Pseudomonadota bacterium]MCG2748688.1 1-acyl-sn-glycerol-3-phosphate acyltransferase [Desulfobulbaceae bacterium]
MAAIRSAVIVCNHLSYLDPLLLIALLERHRTIVKTRFFTMPIFGWVLKKAGYLPASGKGQFAGMMIDQLESMKSFLQRGGNLFIFPEGTRSRDGKIGNLNRGALKIARLCNAPVYVLQLANTDKLFTPGKFLFNTRITNTISLKIIDCIQPTHPDNMPSTAILEQRVLKAYRKQQK